MMNKGCRGVGPILGFALFVATSPAKAQSVFPAGGESKRTGLESALASRNAPAVLYNPANLTLSSPVEPFFELGYVSVEQTYEHRDFDQVRVRVRTPFLSLGYAGSAGLKDLYFGVLVQPVRRGEQEIDGLPRRIAGIFETLEVTNSEEAWQYGLGTAYKLPYDLSLGLSMVVDSEKRSLKANQVGDDQQLIRLDTRGTFYTPRFGIRYEPGKWLRAALAYRPARIKTYKGSQKAATSEGTTDPTVANYEPASWGLGLGSTWQQFIAELHLNWQNWKSGRTEYREGITSSAGKSDLSDIVERSLLLGYEITPDIDATLAYGIQPSPWGSGRYTGEVSEAVTGADFGQINNVERRFLALGSSIVPSPDTQLTLAAMRSVGEREIGDTGDRPGFYQSEIFLLSASARAQF